MKEKSTHKGNCQVCDRLQMLPNGRLSKHGYTKRFHYFEGVCPGAKYLPFQQDTSLIPPMIENAKATAKRHRTAAKTWRSNKTYVVKKSVYSSDIKMQSWDFYNKFKKSSILVEGTLSARKDKPEDKFTKLWFTCTVDGKEYNFKLHGVYTHLDEYRDQLNESQAIHHNGMAKNFDEYVAWQTKRLKEWKPQPLIPV